MTESELIQLRISKFLKTKCQEKAGNRSLSDIIRKLLREWVESDQ